MEDLQITGVPQAEARTEARAGGWGLVHYLALVGAAFTLWQAVTVIPWLLDGPTQITEFRDRDSVSWYAARFYEGLAIVMAIGVGSYVLRGCLRERRLTFDAKLCIAGLSAFWIDPGTNWIQPLWTFSSNWVNLANWSGYQPLVVNPDAGRMPEPVLFLTLIYLFGLLLFAMIINAGMRFMRQQWPSLSNLQILGIAWVFAVVVDLGFEIPMFAFRLFAFPGAPDELKVFGLPLPEMVPASMIFMGLASARYFKDENGRPVVHRGLERTPQRLRGVTSVLALVGVTNGLLFAGVSTQMPMGLYSDPYPDLPAHLSNDMCGPDTRYGDCPGSEGYRIPLSLPGEKPYH